MSNIGQRLVPLAGCAFAVFAGIAHMALGGAPTAYIAVNGAALIIAALVTLSPGPQPAVSARIAAMAVLGVVLALPLLLDPFSGEVRRWIALGPVSLHAAMLVLPALLALAAQTPRAWPVVLGFASAAAALAPDRATACALVCAGCAMLLRQRGPSALLAAALTVLGLLTTLLRPDTLEPVAFVEQVIREAWLAERWTAPLMALGLALAIALPVWLRRDAPTLAFSGCIGGFALAAMLGAYPFPLIGYGASAILGFGLGVRMLGRSP